MESENILEVYYFPLMLFIAKYPKLNPGEIENLHILEQGSQNRDYLRTKECRIKSSHSINNYLLNTYSSQDCSRICDISAFFMLPSRRRERRRKKP